MSLNQIENTTSAAHVLKLSNTGTVSVGIGSIGISGTGSADFALTTTCGATLTANATCTISVTFTPASLAAFSASLTVSGSLQVVTLSGIGVSPTALSATALNFGDAALNQASAVKSVSLYNYQQTPITVSAVATPSIYAVTGGTCGATLAASSSCTIHMTLTPAATGTAPAGTLTVTTNAPNTLAPVALSGIGVL